MPDGISLRKPGHLPYLAVFGALAALFSVCIAAFILDLPALASLIPGAKPVSPMLAIPYLGYAIVFIILELRPPRRKPSIALLSLSVFALAISLTSAVLILAFPLPALSSSVPLRSIPLRGGYEPSLMGTLGMGALSIGILLSRASRRGAASLASDGFLALAGLAGFFSIIGHSFGIPFPGSGYTFATSLPSGIGLVSFSAAVLRYAPASSLARVIFPTREGAPILRAFLASAFLSAILLSFGLFRIIARRRIGDAGLPAPNASLLAGISLALLVSSVASFSSAYAHAFSRLKASRTDLRGALIKLSAFWDIASLEEASGGELARHALGAIMAISESPAGFFGFIDEDGSGFTVYAEADGSGGARSSESTVRRVPLTEGAPWTEAARTGKPVIMNGPPASGADADLAFPDGRRSVSRLLVVPVAAGGRVKSIAVVADRAAAYGDEDAARLAAFCFNVQSAIDRRLVEADLAAEKRLLAVTLDSIGDAVLVCDANSRVVSANPEARRLLDLPPSPERRTRGEEVLRLVDSASREDRPSPVLASISNGGEEVKFDNACVVGKSGSVTCVEGVSSPIRDPNGLIIGSITVFRDVTARLKADGAIRRLENFEALGTLASGVGHDFNNLLGGIFGYVHMARASLSAGNDEACVSFLDKAESVYDRAKDLASRLLAAARGGNPSKRFGDAVACIRETAEFALSGSNIVLEFDSGLGPCAALFAPNQIGQIVENLVINAKQAMPAGGKLSIRLETITVRDGEHPPLDAGSYLRASFRDTGPGIPVEVRSQLFSPYFTTKSGGNGLGLYTSLAIAQRHGGWLDADSPPGSGAVFSLLLPLAAAGESEPRSAAVSALFSGSGPVLLLDDEDYNLEIGSDMLSALGFEPHVCRTGEEAFREFERAATGGKPYRAAFLDLTIPGEGGAIDVAKRIFSLDKNAKAVATSGYRSDPVIADPTSYGFVASLRKPFRIEDLAPLIPVIMGSQEDSAPSRES